MPLLPSPVSEPAFTQVNSVTHEGKVLLFATGESGKIWYAVKQDGFEDNALQERQGVKGWEDWKELPFPDEADDESVLTREKEEWTRQNSPDEFLLRSRYRTRGQSAAEAVQLISGLGHIYVFRQSKATPDDQRVSPNTLLVDRYVLDGMTNELVPKLEVRFKRSRQRHEPLQQTKNGNGHEAGLVDSLDFRDANQVPFREPTTELSLIRNVENGWFSVVLVQTNELDQHRWHIFAYNMDTWKVEMTSIRASADGLFDVKDTLFPGEKPHHLSGIIRRELNLHGQGGALLTPKGGPAATKYDIQRERRTDEGMQLFRETTRIMLAVPTHGNQETVVLSLALAPDGTVTGLSESTPVPTVLRSNRRDVPLPLSTLEEIRTLGDTTPPPHGTVGQMWRGDDDEVCFYSNAAPELAYGDLVDLQGSASFDGLYRATVIDEETIEIQPRWSGQVDPAHPLGTWKKVEEEPAGLRSDGMILFCEPMYNGSLKLAAPGHGLSSGEEVQVVGTGEVNGRHPVVRVNGQEFAIGRKWQSGEAVNLRLKKRRGLRMGPADLVVVEGVKTTPFVPTGHWPGQTWSAWVQPDGGGAQGQVILGSEAGTGLMLENGHAKFNAFYDNRFDLLDPTPLPGGEWTHLAATMRHGPDHGEATLVLYRNGEPVVTKTTGLPSTSEPGQLPKVGIGGYFTGKISEAQIWDRVRDAQEIMDGMHLQPPGHAAGLAGYWRLGGMANGKVQDFSRHRNDGSVVGDPYISEITLPRYLRDQVTPAVRYANADLVTVAERAAYEESFEFRLLNDPAATPEPFRFTYRGRRSRSARQESGPDAFPDATASFEDLGDGWRRARCRVTIPEGVSLLRAFEVSDVTGDWTEMEVRKHRLTLVSDSISQDTYSDELSLAEMGREERHLSNLLETISMAESKEGGLERERQDLVRQIYDLKHLKEAKARKSEEIARFQTWRNYLEGLVRRWQTEKDQAQLKVGMYKHENYRGDTIAFGLGLHNLPHPLWKEVTSFTVPQGLHLTCYAEDRQSFVATANSPNVGRAWNDWITAIWVRTLGGYDNETWIDQNLADARKGLESTTQALKKLEAELAALNQFRNPLREREERLKTVEQELQVVTRELQSMNLDYGNARATHLPQANRVMPALVSGAEPCSSGAILRNLRPHDASGRVFSRLSMAETCEGNVHLNYIDGKGSAKSLVYDAALDSRNATGEEWLPSAHRFCCATGMDTHRASAGGPVVAVATLNCSPTPRGKHLVAFPGPVVAVATLNCSIRPGTPISLGREWSIECWFYLPLVSRNGVNTLADGAPLRIEVRGGWLGCVRDSKPQEFLSSGYNLEVLETGWHHIAAVTSVADGKGALRFFIDGLPVGNAVPAPESVMIDTLGADRLKGLQTVGKLAEFRIWEVALTEAEVEVNSRIVLSGHEPGLRAYYPLDLHTASVPFSDNSMASLYGARQFPQIEDKTHHANHAILLNGDQGNPFCAFSNPIGKAADALVANNGFALAEYSTIEIEKRGDKGRKSALMRRCLAYPATGGVRVLQDQRIETLVLQWVGNAQFAPTLLGYIEGAPPVPSENLTEQDSYNGATAVELTVSEDVEFSWNRDQDTGGGADLSGFVGVKSKTESVVGLGAAISTVLEETKTGANFNLGSDTTDLNSSNVTVSSGSSFVDRLELRGNPETKVKFDHLGRRFIPKNVGYALVISGTADVYITKLKRSGRTVGSRVTPNPDIPPDINTITFLINPAYTMNGSLDGQTGSSATSARFFRHVPEMRSQYGSMYPASYFRIEEAYDLKRQIEQQDKNREAYFQNFNSRLCGEAAIEYQAGKTEFDSAPIQVNRAEDKPDGSLSEEERQGRDAERAKNLAAEADRASQGLQASGAAKKAEIEAKVKDYGKRLQATESFAKWQKKMEDLAVRAGKRNIVNTYVWDADGGLRSESQQFASTIEHTIGSSLSITGGIGTDLELALAKVSVELSPAGNFHLTQTMNKTESRSKGFELSVDLSGVESSGVTDYNDYPLQPGEKVDRYRFMSFYLEGSTRNFTDFFSCVVDPEWLASNDEEARALRQAQGKANKTWRVLHRVTYVERPALMGLGRDLRPLSKPLEKSDVQKLAEKVDRLEAHLQDILRQLSNLATHEKRETTQGAFRQTQVSE